MIPDITDRFPEGFSGIDMTDRLCGYESRNGVDKELARLALKHHKGDKKKFE